MAALRNIVQWIREFLPRTVVEVFIIFFMMGILYRGRLYHKVQTSLHSPFALDAKGFPALYLFHHVWQDILVALGVALGFWLLVWFRRSWLPRHNWPGYIKILLVPLAAIFFGVGYGSHFQLVFMMNSGLVFDLLMEGVNEQTGDVGFFKYVTWMDMVVLFAPVLLFALLTRLTGGMRVWMDRLLALMVLAVLGMVLAGLYFRQPGLPDELRANPGVYLASDIIARFTAHEEAPDLADLGDQMRSVAFSDPRFVKEVEQAGARLRGGEDIYNVVFIIMESTGFRYVFDQSHKNEIPMPFLKKLSEESWWFTNHNSSSNSSARSLFSLFSGLYTKPQVEFFVTRKDVVVPSYFSFVPKRKSLLVTPGPLHWYFPRAFLAHSGIKEMQGFDELRHIPRMNELPNLVYARDERLTTQFFLERLEEKIDDGPGPFHAVYYSMVPHWPYTSYGKEYNIFPWMAESLKLKYYNNLRLLDTQIERIYRYVEKRGLLDKTIFVITGDHGEAFGQHAENYIHSRASYQENVHIPLLFHNKEIFEPRVEERYTSHVDILPTLLDAMKVEYNPELFHGESLLNENLKRKYVFFYGNENNISSIDVDTGVKVQINLTLHACTAYDLKNDPNEWRARGCREYEDQREALRFFKEYSGEILGSYNKQLQTTGTFFDQTHPDRQLRALEAELAEAREEWEEERAEAEAEALAAADGDPEGEDDSGRLGSEVQPAAWSGSVEYLE